MLSDDITNQQKYDPAMKMTDPEMAADYFKECVAHTMKVAKVSQEEAEEIEKSSLAYYAGYFDDDTRERVEKLFDCEHPVFGSIAKTGRITDPKEAFEMGQRIGGAANCGVDISLIMKQIKKEREEK